MSVRFKLNDLLPHQANMHFEAAQETQMQGIPEYSNDSTLSHNAQNEVRTRENTSGLGWRVKP
jgi:hypothetical protein